MAEPSSSKRTGGPATPAATVVPIRDGEDGLEVLLLRRTAEGAFGGMWVFPGGKVEAGDLVSSPAAASNAALSPTAADLSTDPEIEAARRAAVREAEEEAGLRLSCRDLVVHSYWAPPPEAPRRFLTWFFLAPVTSGGSIAVDKAEVHEHRWLRPADALVFRDQGAIALPPPTWMTLWWLSRHADVASAIAAAAAQPPVRWASRVGIGTDGKVAATLWDGDAGYEDGDLDRPGRRRRLWLDPTGWRAEMDE